MRYTITSVARFARQWSLQGWVIPVVFAAVLSTLAFSLLTRAVPTVESQRTSDFGGRSMLIATNTSVDPVAEPDRIPAAIEQLETAGASDVCGYVISFIQPPGALDGVLTYREQLTGCHEADWGYKLLEGTWPALPGEVAATEATGLQVGDVVEGPVPADLTVVAVAASATARDSTASLAAAGTWESWDLDSVWERYPGLSGRVQIVLNGNPIPVDEAATNLFGPSASIAEADAPPQSLAGSFPFLYQWPATVLAALGGGWHLPCMREHRRSGFVCLRTRSDPPRSNCSARRRHLRRLGASRGGAVPSSRERTVRAEL